MKKFLFLLVVLAFTGSANAVGNCQSSCCNEFVTNLETIYKKSMQLSVKCWSAVEAYGRSDAGKAASACSPSEENTAKEMKRYMHQNSMTCETSSCVEVRQKNGCVKGKNLKYYRQKFGL